MRTDRDPHGPAGPDAEERIRMALSAASAAITPRSIDDVEVVRRARRRRAPRLAMVGTMGALLLLGIGTATVQSLQPFGHDTTTIAESDGGQRDDTGSATTGDDAPSSSTESSPDAVLTAPVAEIARCGAPEPAARAAAGLTLQVEFNRRAMVADGPLEGTVILTNTGALPVIATSPVVASVLLSSDGEVVWHSHGLFAQVVTELALAPGQSQRYPATLEPLHCVNEEQLERGTAPTLDPGVSRASAVLELVRDDGEVIRLISDAVEITFE